MASRSANLLLAAALMAGLVWPVAWPDARPVVAAPVGESPEDCLQDQVINKGVDLEQAKAACQMTPAIQSQIDAIVASNAGKLVDDGIAKFRECLAGKVYTTYMGFGSPALAGDAEAACMGVMEASFWTKAPAAPEPDPIEAMVARNAGKLVDGGVEKLVECLNGRRNSAGVVPPEAEAACMGVMEASFWTKGPGAQIDAVVARNAGKLVDGGAAKLAECLQGRLVNDALPPDAEAACMGVMEAGFWTKQNQPTAASTTSCDGARVGPAAGLLMALWADPCDDNDNDDDSDDNDDRRNDNDDDEHKKKKKKDGGGCSC